MGVVLLGIPFGKSQYWTDSSCYRDRSMMVPNELFDIKLRMANDILIKDFASIFSRYYFVAIMHVGL